MKRVLLVLFISLLAFGSNAQQVIYDIEGNAYDTLKIGNQIWFKQNLKTTKYNDGSPISFSGPKKGPDGEWYKTKEGAYAWHFDNIEYKDTIGALYNWFAASSGKLCPEGWRVPTDKDWKILADSLGGLDVAGKKIRNSLQKDRTKEEVEADPITPYWMESDIPTNESGFSALPGGTRSYEGAYDGYYMSAYFWGSTSYSKYYGWYVTTGFASEDLKLGKTNKNTGMSVRCVRDDK